MMIRKLFEKNKSMPTPMKASMWFLLASFIQKGLATITTPIFTRILSNMEYGQYSVFNSWLSILTPIISLNLYAGVYAQGIIKFEEERKKYSSSLQGLCLSFVAVWTVVYLIFKDFLNELFSFNTIQGLAMLAIIWASSTFSFWSMNQRVDFKYKKLVILTVLVSVIQPVTCVFLILNSDDKVTARILGVALVQILFYGWTFVSQVIQGKQFFSKKYWIYALKFNIPLLPHYLSIHLLASSDRIMIGNMVGDAQAGIYNLAHSLALIMIIFNTALLQTIEPWIYRKLKAKRVMDISKIACPSFIGVAVVNILLILFAPEAIAIFAPEEYYEAIYVIPGVALSVYFMFLYTFFATFEFYYEKKSYIASATVGGAVLNIVLNYVCIKMFGYVAAGYTTMFSYMMFSVLHYYFCTRICKEFMGGIRPYNVRMIFGISIVTTMIGLSMLLVYPYTILRYGIIIALAAVIIVFRDRVIQYVKMILAAKKSDE